MTMTPEQALKVAIEYLAEAGIEYMIAGSFASNLHGMPRTTQDADLVIIATPSSLDRFVSLITEDFYVSAEAARDALKRAQMFNIVHFETGFKIDLIFQKRRAHALEEFKRRQQVEFLGKECWFATAEDTILTKLEWSREGKSKRQFGDAVGVAEVQGDDLGWDYLENWAKELDIEELYKKLLAELGRKRG